MAHTRLHTGFPATDPRVPQFAPLFGAQPLINEPERTVEEALTDAPTPRSGDIRLDPWPEIGVGVVTAALAGGLTGGVAAGSWAGAAIGGGLNVAGWSVFTLLNSWRVLGSRARSIALGAGLLGAAATGTGIYLRRRR